MHHPHQLARCAILTVQPVWRLAARGGHSAGLAVSGDLPARCAPTKNVHEIISCVRRLGSFGLLFRDGRKILPAAALAYLNLRAIRRGALVEHFNAGCFADGAGAPAMCEKSPQTFTTVRFCH